MTDFWRWAEVWFAVLLIGVVVTYVVLSTTRPEPTVVTTSTTSIPVELIPPMTTPTPTLTQRAADVAFDIRGTTESGWIDSLSDVDLVLYVRAVCADFDQDLWFWDMYEQRLDELADQGWASEASALQIVMGDGVTALCAYNQDRLPSELLGD